ncbi:MAG: GTP cyclohydrolase II RibA, partial [Spirochaeta sp.]
QIRGVVLYLRQEGRGIGLINKIRAYHLQDQGMDTIQANLHLGFPAEARDYWVAAEMLRLLKVSSIALLTNNPDKIVKLKAEGIEITRRIPLVISPNPHNEYYLETKRDHMGHLY